MSNGLDPILQQKEQQQLRTQLLWRLAIAAVLVGGVLFAIYWLDQASTRPNLEISTPRIASAISLAEEEKPASAASAAISSGPSPVSTTAPTPSTAPTAQPTPALAPNKSAVEAIANVPPKAATPNRPVISANSSATTTPARSSLPVRETGKTPAPTAILQLALPTLAPLEPQNFPEPVNGKQGLTVQAGVFLHEANAARLLQQLQKAGVPAYLETRVQIGPFRNKAEADAAIRKLRAMGITPVIKSEN